MRGHCLALTDQSLRSLAVLIFLVIGLIFLLGAIRPSPAAQSQEDCQACHEDMVKAFSRNPHQKETCTACHKGAEKHLEEGTKGTIFAFSPQNKPAEKSQQCLACHHNSAGHYASSPHSRGGLDCTSCHSVHANQNNSLLLAASATNVCASCHEDTLAEFNLNERHRLRERILECTSCHNPHEPSTRERLAGFKHEACLKCHAEKGGPFLYEHAASRIEGCTACHVPHGSPNRHLLIQQSISDLCFSCHGSAPAWHSRFTSTATNCTTCHVAIHGSNLSPIFIK